MNKYFNILCLSFTLLISNAGFAENYEDLPYHKLMLMDLDEVNQLINKSIDSSRKSDDPKSELLKGLKVLLSRPDEDGLIRKLLPSIKGELEATIDLNSAYFELATQAIASLKNAEKNETNQITLQINNAIILENIISELRPVAKKDATAKKTIAAIADANIKITESSINERKVRVLKFTQSPSKTAEELIKMK